MISSADVYSAAAQVAGKEPPSGDPKEPIAEDAPLRKELYPHGRRTSSPWGEIDDYEKILVERVTMGDPSLPATVLRLPMVYGPGDPQRRFDAYLDARRGGAARIPMGEQQATWRFTHGYVDDIAHAIAIAAAHPRGVTRVYNLGERSTPTFAERLHVFGDSLGWRGEFDRIPDAHVPFELRGPTIYPRDVLLDSTRIRTELGYEENTSVENAARATTSE